MLRRGWPDIYLQPYIHIYYNTEGKRRAMSHGHTAKLCLFSRKVTQRARPHATLTCPTPPGITRPQHSYDPVRLPFDPSGKPDVEGTAFSRTDLPRLPGPSFQRAVPITPADRNGCICRLLPHPTRPSPLCGRVGIHNFTFEACSGFTRVTARWIAQLLKAAFVARLRSAGYPDKSLASYQINRQLSGWNPASTDGPRLRGALNKRG